MSTPEIGDLEAKVLEALKSLGKASAGQVVNHLRPKKSRAYTTVSTTLERLYRKGLVSRSSISGKNGLVYVYAYAENPRLEKQVVNGMVDKLVSAFGPSVASHIYDRLDRSRPPRQKSKGGNPLVEEI